MIFFLFTLLFKTVRVAVFAEGPAADEARAAGADVVGGDELIEEIRTGTLFPSVESFTFHLHERFLLYYVLHI
jgi:ribosomal protein L1